MAGENYAQGGKHEDLISVVYPILQQYPSTLSAKGTPFRKRQKEKTSLPASNLVMTADLFLPIHEPFAWKHASSYSFLSNFLTSWLTAQLILFL